MEKEIKFKQINSKSQIKSMIKLDFRRMFKSKIFYIILVCAFVIPILITVMMTMMDGKVNVDPQTGVETIMEGPENAWQSIGIFPTTEESETADMGGMDVMSMCNINLMFILVVVFIGLFISDDFKSGYAKNIFTVHSDKTSYVISKTISSFVCGALMLILYFVGAMLGGAMSNLSFDLGILNATNILMCMMSKIFLMLVFVSIFVLISIAAKQRTWLAICGSLAGGMILFTMVSMITPLNATVMNMFICLLGGVIFSVGFGFFSVLVLRKTNLV